MLKALTYLVGEGVPLGDLVENVGDGAGQDTTIRIALGPTRDGVGLTRARLTIGKDRPVVPLEAGLYHLHAWLLRSIYIFGYCIEDCLLLGQHV
jgi:hypothetical protein